METKFITIDATPSQTLRTTLLQAALTSFLLDSDFMIIDTVIDPECKCTIEIGENTK